MNSKNRLQQYRKRASDLNQRYSDLNQRYSDLNQRYSDLNQRYSDLNQRHGKNYTWRDCIYKKYNSYIDTINKSEDGTKWYCENAETIGSVLGDAHDLRRMDHTGWYVDDMCGAVMRGAVIKMRTSKGAYYIPYTYCTEWDGITAYIEDAIIVPRGSEEDEHDQAIKDVAYYADLNAQREAEDAKEYYAKDQAEQDILTAKENIGGIRDRVSALVKDYKTINNKLPPTICGLLVSAVNEARRDIHSELKIIAARKSDFWTAWNY